MNTMQMIRAGFRRCAVVGAAVGVAGLGLSGSGCQTPPSEAVRATTPALRPIEPPPGATPADAQRAALARFVGNWRFEGWRAGEDGTQHPVAGRAAGVIESQHFLLLDLQGTSPQAHGGLARKSASMLFASEPEVGLTLTTWGDASPAMNRFFGSVDEAASVFSFTEARTPAGRHRLEATLTFETDDRWIAEIRDATASDRAVIARHVFTRTE